MRQVWAGTMVVVLTNFSDQLVSMATIRYACVHVIERFQMNTKLSQAIGVIVNPIRQRIDALEISNTERATRILNLIPATCPFEREIVFPGHKVVKVPPLCKVNPLYEELVALRFRALSYLADQGEDVTQYIT